MHFWIDKRSQVCSLSRGRYGRTPAAAAASSRLRGVGGSAGVGGCKVMVTPVHRFQPIESTQAASLRRHAHHLHHHRPRPHHLSSGGGGHPHHLATPASPNHSRFAHSSGEPSLELAAQEISESSVLVGSGRGGGGMSLLPHGAVGQGLEPQQQVLLRLPAPQREVLASGRVLGRLKCGLWATVAFISFSVAIARFYAQHRGTGLEILYLILCALLLMLLCCGYTISRCSSTGPPRGCFVPRSAQARYNNSHNLGPRSALIDMPEEEVSGPDSLPPHVQHQAQQSDRPLLEAQQSLLGAPPPYHIAIWLPQPEGEPPAADADADPQNPEVPPPSYDKATS